MDDYDHLIALADAAIDARRIDEALRHAARAIELDGARAAGHYKKALAHQALMQLGEAEAGYRRALELEPTLGKAFNNLGLVHLYRGKREAAIDAFRRAIAADATIAEPHSNLGLQLLASSAPEQALECFRRAVAIDAGYADAQLHLVQYLLDTGDAAQAAACHRRALAADKGGGLELRLALQLPEMMASRAANEAARAQLSARLAALEARPRPIEDPIAALPQTPWFFLAYHGLDDRPLVERIGAYLRRACPSIAWEAPHCARPARARGPRLRVGFVSSHLRDHTIGKLLRGMIGNLPCKRFELCLFTPEQPADDVTRFLAARVERAATLAPSLAQAREQLAASELDVLFYPDIGMEPFTYYLAHARLAPLQVVSWGHPMTSGIPTLDCFISHAGCEPAGAEKHYTEELLRLPAGDALTYYYRPDTVGLDKTRAHYGLGDADHVYLCAQTLFKLHPDQDAAFRDILAADPKGVLVFIEGDKPLLKHGLMKRLQRVMPGELSRVRFLPVQPYRGFLNLVRVSDVVLDSFVFGGGNSSFESFAVGSPVVTLPSDQMRGRVTLTCCRRTGMEELVAADAADYCAKAVRLGTERDYRENVKSRLAQRANRLFEDGGVVLHLAQLLESAFERRRRY